MLKTQGEKSSPITNLIGYPMYFPHMPQVHFSALSERGLQPDNEDAFYAGEIARFHVFAVAAGIGAEGSGKVASDMAIASFREAIESHPHSPREALGAAVTQVEERLRRGSAAGGKRTPLSTHLCAGIVDKDLVCTTLDTGDGSIYVIGESGISTPRQFAQLKIAGGDRIARCDEGICPSSPLISHVFGAPWILKPADFREFSLKNTYLLLSSDGLYDHLPRETIRDIVLKHGEDVESASEELVQEAMNAGSDSTITVVLVCGEE
jgi:protein phosphatase